MKKYELTQDGMGRDLIKGFLDDDSIIWIPSDPTNSDYQAYLAHVDSEGNK